MSSRPEFGKVPAAESNGDSPPPAPRWVKAFGIAAIAIIVLLIAMLVSGHGGPHSPLRHFQDFQRNRRGTDAPAASGAQRS